LYAPGKQNAYLIGDFNNWIPSSIYQMKKDGDRFWYTLQNLTSQHEYLFQYLVDGSIRIADPYADKVADPNYDKDIPTTTYSNLVAYPLTKTAEITSVLQAGQAAYNWQHPSYNYPKKEDLAIYELLIRDFTTEGTIKAAKEKVPYLKSLGINAIELMPFNEFEGNDSWGYNPSFYFAPDKAYGTKADYKDFIDACHANGIIVIQDIVLNHAYGSSPLVRLYWDNTENRPAANSPWFNVKSPNTAYSWGYDFNHESVATRHLVDSIAKYWMSEYRIDGFRYDFAKGFTNTAGDGSAYDASRIANLKRIADAVWTANPNALVILELFAPNDEEKELAAYSKGMLIWGNANYAFGEAVVGNTSASDFSNAAAASRGYSVPGLVSYMESHDEERTMYKALTNGKSGGLYNIKDKNTALKRIGEASVFFFSIPGPKMIWQFGELGYDISINYVDRTAKKPVHWEYLQDSARYNFVYKVDSTMLSLRKQYPVFTSGTITMSVAAALKRINLSDNDLKVTLLGNFDVYSGLISPEFQQTGTWYEYFTGKTLEVTNTTQKLTLQPGEYRLYTTKKLSGSPNPTAVNNLNEDVSALVYPNPVSSELFIEMDGNSGNIEIYNVSGQKVMQQEVSNEIIRLSTAELKPGLYFIKIASKGNTITHKFIKE
jgi:glycosidase